VAAHDFTVRRGRPNLTPAEWRSLIRHVTDWFPGARLELDLEEGEMGPFGVRVARRVTLTLAGGPETRAAAVALLSDGLARIGRADLLEPRA
jgi:hypothetical protein